MTIERDGTLVVRETIVYDFGNNERHGIERDLVRSENYDDDHDRRYEIDAVVVSTNEGTPDDVALSEQGDFFRVRIGDPDRTISGVHTYDIAYRVTGALLPFPDHDELNWDTIGHQWRVPITAANVAAHAPADIEKVACFSGPEGSRAGCDQASSSGLDAAFAQTNLGQGAGMTVVLALPKGAVVPEPQPLLEERRTLGDAFALTPLTASTAGLLAALGIGGVSLLAYRHGRDRRWTGSAVDAAMGNIDGSEEAIPLGDRAAGPVEFVPPDGVRPGQVGTLVDEQANLLDVTATIVDLAVHEHLRITELADGRHPDYQLERVEGGHGDLKPYERELYDALFATGPTVALSDLKYKFTAELSRVKNALYDDVVANRWYRVRPDRTRLWWRLIGLGVTILGVVLTVLVGAVSSFALIPLALVVTGIALLAVGGRMPARTGRGSAMHSPRRRIPPAVRRRRGGHPPALRGTTGHLLAVSAVRHRVRQRRRGGRAPSKVSTRSSSARRRGTPDRTCSARSRSPPPWTTSTRAQREPCTRASRRRRARAGSVAAASPAAAVEAVAAAVGRGVGSGRRVPDCDHGRSGHHRRPVPQAPR